MKYLRQPSNIESVFPEYFSCIKTQNIVLSKYTSFQKVSADNIVLYSFVSDAIILLSKLEYDKIQTMKFDENDILYENLYKSGFFIDKNINEFSLIDRQRRTIFAAHPKTMKAVILPTTDCNARCNYCIGMRNSIADMTYDTAKKVVDYIVANSNGYDNIKFDWYGGEPLLKENLITFICDEIHRQLPHIKFSSVITSNMACFNDTTLKIALQKWHIHKFNITIDGSETEHNKRKNFFNPNFNGFKHTIDCIKSILDKKIMIFCRYNIDKNNITQLNAVLEVLKPFFNNKNFYFFISPLRGENNYAEFYKTEEYNDLFYKTGVMLNNAGLHNAIDSFVPKFKNGFCLAKSEHSIVIGADGTIYRCNLDDLVESNSTGTIFKGLLKNEVYNRYISLELDEICKMCEYLPICQGGCPVQAKNSSNSNCQCNKFKYKIKAISKLLAEYYI